MLTLTEQIPEDDSVRVDVDADGVERWGPARLEQTSTPSNGLTIANIDLTNQTSKLDKKESGRTEDRLTISIINLTILTITLTIPVASRLRREKAQTRVYENPNGHPRARNSPVYLGTG